ncbi:hypothetical protein D3C71_1581130 [compost metagenome]
MNWIPLLIKQIGKFTQCDTLSELFFPDCPCFMDTKGLLDVGQVATNFVFSKMPNHALQTSGPGLDNSLDSIKTIVPCLLPKFAQDLITGVPTIAEDIYIFTIRIARYFGNRVQSTRANRSFDIIETGIARRARIIRIWTQLI